MLVHTDPGLLPSFARPVITIGTFDGVHLGHRGILRQLKAEAERIGGESVIVTFHPHPRTVVGDAEAAPSLLTTLPERTELLQELGIGHLVVVPFTRAFAALPAEAFVRDFLYERFHPHTLIVGFDHRFGNDRRGDYRLLKEMGAGMGFEVQEIDAQLLQEVKVSSTRIREALRTGDVRQARRLLGYAYRLEAEVVHGDGRGRTIGFPTANLRIADADKLLPADGVYAVRLSLDDHPKAPYTGTGMMNIGIRPTFGGAERVLEVNIFDFEADIYGAKMRVEPWERIRGERRFDGVEGLRRQLECDRSDAMRLLENTGADT